MGYWNTRGLRGNELEDNLNMTHDVYKNKNMAIIQKIPTPITPIKIDKNNKNITLAYFEKKSTVDYIGVVQGIPVCFDAKETSNTSLPMQNIHSHQVEFMQDFVKQNGVAFFLVHFKKFNKYFYLPFEDFYELWILSQNNGRKSIPFDSFKDEYKIKIENNYLIHYLEALNTYLVNSKK